jgi:membrane associated rhomboid family serine protease
VSVHVPRAWATWSLLVTLASLFVLQQIAGDGLASLALQPAAFRPWQLVTYAGLHAGLAHLLANAACLACFGPRVEFAIGPARYLALLAASAAGGGLLQFLTGQGACVGASGAVYGLLAAGWVLWPRDRLLRATVATYAGLALLAAASGPAGTGEAVWAHLGGLLAGLVSVALVGVGEVVRSGGVEPDAHRPRRR